jgi:hypothetical protein
MAATVNVQEGNGASVSWTTKTSVRFCTSDNNDPGTTYPTPIPSADFNYSYWKSICLALSGSFTKINNVKVYCDGTIGFACGTSGGVFVGLRDSGDNGCPAASYQQSAGSEGVTGYDIGDAGNGHAYYKGQSTPKALLSGYTSGAPLTVDTGDHTSAEVTKHIVLQWKIATDATRGLQSAETITWLYDEI